MAELSDRIDAIHPDLAWELSPGQSAAHALVVSGEGVAELRAVAERVRRAAPPADETFEYRSSRGRDHASFDATMVFDDVEIELAETRFGANVDSERAKIDVVVHNPAMSALGEHARTSVAFLSLDWALGEDDVERWIGTVGVATELPSPALSYSELASLADELGSSLEEEWLLMEGTDDGAPVVVMVRRPLRRVDWPLFDRRLDVAVRLPDDLNASEAQSLEDELAAVLGDDGVHAATTTEIARGLRTTHLYVDATSDVAARVSAAVERAALTEHVEVTLEHDPAWSRVQPYM